MKITAILFCSFIMTTLWSQNECYLIAKKGDFCFETSDFVGYSAKFSEKLKVLWFRTPKSKKTVELQLPDTLPGGVLLFESAGVENN